MTMKEDVRSKPAVGDDLSPDSMFDVLPGYFSAADMARAFNIPVDDEGTIAAVRKWVDHHGEYDLVEIAPGKWIAPHTVQV